MQASPKPKRFRPPKPRTTPLKRGQACLNCRHLKVRCDGVHPACGNCVRVPKYQPCTFNGPPRTRRHQHGEDESKPISDPSAGRGYWSPARESDGSQLDSPPDSIAESSSNSPRSDSDLELQEPRLETVRQLLDNFILHAVQLGFFLHIDRFRHAALRPQPLFGLDVRPSAALLSAVYLWGAHLSLASSLFKLTPEFLREALHHISTAETANALETIQAHVLLSHYLLLQKRLLAAQVHANSAATLAVGCRLHELGCSSPTEWFPSMLEQTPLDPAHDFVEQGERIRCFWTVVSLQAELNLAMGSASESSLCILEIVGANISTPWPMAMVEYDLIHVGGVPPQLGRGDVVQRLMMEEPGRGVVPVAAAQAQAAVLLHRALALSEKFTPDLLSPDFATYLTVYNHLDERINVLHANLPPIDAYTPAGPELVRTYVFTAAASITANRPISWIDPDARRKCVVSAREILRYLALTTDSGWNANADAMYAPMCALACRVLVDEIQSLRVFNLEWMHALGALAGEEGLEDDDAGADLQNGLLVLASYALGSPLAAHYQCEIQKEYSALYGASGGDCFLTVTDYSKLPSRSY
ncbi:hypothetical protein FB45DRAFT_869005 [Roridomyces roridus]|uniref:Zn(2)-C6 fungal-type domain-containing protein n=1 Tax=Roridomyces roridus TaxID=1738132 RepID=A0AAD7BNI2_9AGAR|nr:hypothetical protein FB45DRAFT_869005 [Roridomyces roridus]